MVNQTNHSSDKINYSLIHFFTNLLIKKKCTFANHSVVV